MDISASLTFDMPIRVKTTFVSFQIYYSPKGLSIYVLKSDMSFVYLFYRLLLSKETFHRFNRIALLGILFLSLLIPFIEVTIAMND